jgi:hypothetical protein
VNDKYIAIFGQINVIFLFSCKFFSIFAHQNPGSVLVPIKAKMLDPDLESMNSDPKHKKARHTYNKKGMPGGLKNPVLRHCMLDLNY